MDLTALFRVSYGVYVVSSAKGDLLNGQISNTVFQVTSEPPQIEIAVNKLNLTHQLISDSGKFSVAILNEETPMKYIGRFGFRSGRDFKKYDGIEYRVSDNGLPIPLDYTVAHLECEITHSLDVGTHTLFIGKVIGCEVHTEDQPMTYAYYHEVKKGKEPETAPTFIKTDKK